MEYWVALIQPGRMLYEIEGVSEELARQAFSLAAAKLPLSNHVCQKGGDVMKASALRARSLEELRQDLRGLLREQFNLLGSGWIRAVVPAL